MTTSRTPYVGSGEDGCRRSAQIDREEADRLSWAIHARRNWTGHMGSWEHQVLDVLVQWASGGNNREHPGRLRVQAQS
jgi:hypothetical protein